MPSSTLELILDRIEGTRAILEVGGERVEIPAAALPPGTPEGSLLRLVVLAADPSDALARLRRLSERDPGTDNIDL